MKTRLLLACALIAALTCSADVVQFAVEAEPPRFSVEFAVPQEDRHFIWHSGAEYV